jgi:hypothetical protein
VKIKVVLILTVFVLFCLHLSSCKQCDKEEAKTKIQSNMEDVMENTATATPFSSDANPSSDPNVAPVAITTTPESAYTPSSSTFLTNRYPSPNPVHTPTPSVTIDRSTSQLLFDIGILIRNADGNVVVKTRARCTGRLNFKLRIKNGASCKITDDTTDILSGNRYMDDISWIVLDKSSGASFLPDKSKIGESVIFKAPDTLNECWIQILFDKAAGTNESDNNVEYYNIDTVKGTIVGAIGKNLSNNHMRTFGGVIGGNAIGNIDDIDTIH